MRHVWPCLLLESSENAGIPLHRGSLSCCSVKPTLGELTQPRGAP